MQQGRCQHRSDGTSCIQLSITNTRRGNFAINPEN